METCEGCEHLDTDRGACRVRHAWDLLVSGAQVVRDEDSPRCEEYEEA